MDDLQEYAQNLKLRNGQKHSFPVEAVEGMKGLSPQRACGEILQSLQRLLEDKNALIRQQLHEETALKPRAQRMSASVSRRSGGRSPDSVGTERTEVTVSRRRRSPLKFTRIWTKSDERMMADIVAEAADSAPNSGHSDSKEAAADTAHLDV